MFWPPCETAIISEALRPGADCLLSTGITPHTLLLAANVLYYTSSQTHSLINDA